MEKTKLVLGVIPQVELDEYISIAIGGNMHDAADRLRCALLPVIGLSNPADAVELMKDLVAEATTMKRTKKVLKYVTQSQLSECLNIAINGDIPAAAELLRIALFPDVILLDEEEVIELMKDLVAEDAEQNSTKIHTRFKIGDKVYFYREARLQCYPISGIEIGPDPGSITYKICTYCISIPENDLFKTIEEAHQDLENFFKALDLS